MYLELHVDFETEGVTFISVVQITTLRTVITIVTIDTSCLREHTRLCGSGKIDVHNPTHL